MCTVVVSYDPAADMPVLLLGVRDELVGRPWQPPARHWPPAPLIGGLDEEAGGTWLAVHPGLARVGCVLNGRGTPADPGGPAGRRSRGSLPLGAAAGGAGELDRIGEETPELAAYDPFHLVSADLSGVGMLSWDGRRAVRRTLDPGTHLLTNAGYGSAEPKAARFGPRFAARRPSGDPAAPLAAAWLPWLTLADGDGLPATDPAAIIVRRELPGGRLWGTSSVSLVALGPGGLRYDFQPAPGDRAAWSRVR